MTKSERLALAQGVFTDWRMERKSKAEPIPENLWGLAVSLLKHHTVAEVARALRLNATTLKKKAETTPPVTEMPVPRKRVPEQPTFLETRMAAITAVAGDAGGESQNGCLIQIRRADGAQMNIHRSRLTSTELRQLICGFCG